MDTLKYIFSIFKHNPVVIRGEGSLHAFLASFSSNFLK